MNDMNDRRLEARIHRELRALPSLRAPRTLAPRVLAAIAARHAAPWFRRSWNTWPLAMKISFFGLGFAALGGLVFLGTVLPQLATETVGPADWLFTQFAGLKPYYDFAARLAHSLGTALQGTGNRLLWYLAALLAVAYATCIGLGTLGYRLVFNRI